MQRLSLLLSVVAVGLAGYIAWNESAVRSEVAALRSEADARATLEARIDVIEKAQAAKAVEAPRLVDAPKPVEGATLSGAPPATASAGAVPATAAKTVEALEKRIAALEKSGSSGDDVEKLKRGMKQSMGRFPGMPSFYGSVDDAEKDLDLSAGQKSDFDRIVQDAKQELSDLHKIRDDDGKTWDDVQKDTFKMDGGSIRLDFGKLQAFKDKNVPGRSETFGAADQRIRKQAKDRMRNALTSEQQPKLDKANVDPLFGGGPGGMTFAVSSPVILNTDDK